MRDVFLGTLGFEALLSILGVGPGVISTRRFAFETLPLSPQGTVVHVRKPQFHRHPRANEAGVGGEYTQGVGGGDSDSDSDDGGDGGEGGSEQAEGRLLGSLPEVLFSDNNEDSISTVKNNIHTFCSRLNVTDSGSVVKRFHSPAKLNFLTSSLYNLLGSLDTQTVSASSGSGPKSDARSVVALLLNPPYGQRLGKNTRADSNYRAIGKRVVEIRDHIASGGIGYCSGKGTNNSTPQLMGYILCPDQPTWSAFMLCLSQKKFGVKTTHFTHGGNDTRLVSFWDTS
jgi:hypothetical protein